MAHQVAGQAGATPTIQATGEGAEINNIRMMMMMLLLTMMMMMMMMIMMVVLPIISY